MTIMIIKIMLMITTKKENDKKVVGYGLLIRR